MKNQFELISEYKPSGDQPEAIRELVSGLKEDKKFQVLLGATGTGKTFTIPNLKNFFHIIVWNISSLILIITSQKPICQKQIHILIKTQRPMKNWICLEWQL